MSLTWDVSKIKDFKKVTTDPRDATKWHSTTQALIWLALPCLYSEITEKNHEELFERIHMYEHARGAQRTNALGELYITLDNVRDHIGFKCNVTPKSMQSFKLNLARMCYEDAHSAMLHQKKEWLEAYHKANPKPKEKKNG
jgi:hypothetical protein